MNPALPVQTSDDCWNVIGVGGDRSCGELATHLHCRNCPVYAARGKRLFDREPPPGYREEWAERLAVRDELSSRDAASMVVFRLSSEWLAVDVPLVVEVTMPRPVHRIPHRSDDTLLGVTNIRGELQLAVRLQPLLEIEPSDRTEDAHEKAKSRLLVIERAGARWAALVDEVHGVHPFGPDDLVNVPATIARRHVSLVRDVFQWGAKQVGRLNGPQLFESLRGRIG